MTVGVGLPAGIELPDTMHAPGQARAFVRTLVAHLSPSALADAELMTSEIVTNAVRHGRPPIRLDVAADASLVRFSVHDAGVSFEMVAGRVDSELTGGRGLLITAALAATCGVVADELSAGKTVWFAIGADLEPDRH